MTVRLLVPTSLIAAYPGAEWEHLPLSTTPLESSVCSARDELQQVIRDEFVGAIERITGRVVVGFFSGISRTRI